MSAPHIPVLLDEVLAALSPLAGAVFVDGTFGAGGYTRALLEAGAAHVYAIDRDPGALAAGQVLAESHSGRLTLIAGTFGDMQPLLASFGVEKVDGITLDIGVSSMQLDQPERGFSFQTDGPLDMRMSRDGPSAADVVNTASESDLADIIYQLGEEPGARRVARALVKRRSVSAFARTLDFAEVVRAALGGRRGPKDPVTRTFQALRIHVNDELGQLEQGLQAAEMLLGPGGRLAVVAFHSLEDRIVKEFLRVRSGGEPQGSRHMPVVPRAVPRPSFGRPAKAVRAGDAELAVNPRSRSAVLRAAVRTDAPALEITP